MKRIALSMVALALFAACSQVDTQQVASQAVQTHIESTARQQAELKALVQQFYDQLSDPNNVNAEALSAAYMADGWQSTPQPLGGPGRDGFLKTLAAFGGMIPDLNWAVQDMQVSGSTVTVRSIATGTPNSPEGHFFGVPTNGSKKFEIMTIDVHTVENGKMVRAHHVEDWATAIQQVTAK